jgi:predicted Zn finger-like uncharacterized protein
VAEAIHCPSCTTRYRLSPERLKPAMRRAKCFTCGSVFSVGDVVQRLLAPPAEAPLPESASGPAETARPGDLVPAEVPASSLTLGDLESTDPGLLEKTLAAVPDSLPEAKAKTEAAGPFPPEITETTLSGYTSARDAIDKLFGAPSRSDSAALKISPDPSPMDLEATLSALESTLRASPDLPPSAGREGASGPPAEPKKNEALSVGPSSSTLHLSQEEILAAFVASPAPTPATVPAESTVPVRASDLMASEQRPPASPRALTPLADTQEAPEEKLRLKIGEEIYSGLTMPQLIAWVEEGRILENHLVARQHSENWLEAQKVPGLRPAFDRLRRERGGAAPSPDPGPGEAPPKKSLFGGLFGKS